MNQPDILLVNPHFAEDHYANFPLGLLYIASVLRNKGYTVDVFDGTLKKTLANFKNKIEKTCPKIVGITSLITSRSDVMVIAEISKKYGCTVIVGGPDPTSEPNKYLGGNNKKIVDFVVSGEGEITMLELVNHLLRRGDFLPDVRNINGLCFLDKSGELISTEKRLPIENLDTIPFPARDLVDMSEYKQFWKQHQEQWMISMITSRGCPYSCTWCHKGIFGRTFRARSPVNIAEEMKEIKEHYNPDRISFQDDTIGINRKWVFELRDAVLDNNAIIPFEINSRVDLADILMLTALKDIGCEKIYFGVESGSQNVLDLMKKGTKVEQIYNAANLCRQLGIEFHFFMMVGYPGETFVDLKLSLDLLTKTLPDSFSTSIAYPLYGTDFYEIVKENIHPRVMLPKVGENQLIFQREGFNTRYYHWIQRLFQKEWQVRRCREGYDVLPLSKRINDIIGLFVSRFMVKLLG
ncbi:MAG: B12-binding domain-containing radical SAM protein [Bacteroidetes bacterium]|jgi:anaerobic magnesium-protoporphyrin IX monomethyl ester cyclase|nr:B12-binding domain-containing radical SAM protein [Bacteroidota bacterium]